MAAVVGVTLAILRMVARNGDPAEYRVAFLVLFLGWPVLSCVALVRAWRGPPGSDRFERLLIWLILTVAAFVALVFACVWSGAASKRVL